MVPWNVRIFTAPRERKGHYKTKRRRQRSKKKRQRRRPKSRRRNEVMASNKVRHRRDCSDTIEETSSDEGLFRLRPKLCSKREFRNYTVSHSQQHICHSLRVIVVVMGRWCPYLRWCEMTAAYDFIKFCGTGLRHQNAPFQRS